MIKVEHLTKCYGDFMAVKDLSFEIEEGHVYGFLGPNGAGKSTTMNIMTGCLSATEGKVTIGGHDIYEEPEAAKKLIGYLPELPPLYMNETPYEYLRFVARAKGVKGREIAEQVEQVIAETGLDKMKNRLIAALSKGYRQRVGIAQALLGNPKVIILDEPTVGLDPIQIIEIRELIRSLGAHHTVILSSHILSEVQAICEKVLIIAHGQLVGFDTPENLEKLLTSSNGIDLTVEAGKEETEEVMKELETGDEWTVEEGSDGTVHVHVIPAEGDLRAASRSLFAAFAQKGLPVLEMNTKKASLEDVFIELTEDSGEAAAGENAEAEAGNMPESADEEPENPAESEVTGDDSSIHS